MIKLDPVVSTKIWGYENWIASTHANGCQKEFEAFCGGEYPLLVKVIQANEILSLQVHPDDEKAQALEGEGSRGKTECWYVLDACAGAKLVYGFKEGVGKDEIETAAANGGFEELLNWIEVKAGDFVFIPAGTVHAIGGGLRLLEVQQSCDITYRLSDWGRGRECHLEKGLACIVSGKNPGKMENPGKLEKDGDSFKGFECEYFGLRRGFFEGEWKYCGSSSNSPLPRLFFILDGRGTFGGITFEKEDIFALLPGEVVFGTGDCVYMEIFCC